MSCACITLPPALAPSAAYYALMGRYAYARIAMHAPYDKRRKETHRYEVADTRGRLTLTVPVQPPHGIARAQWTDVRLSGHGRWQDVHATSLASAYGRTPFYEFYIDRLAPALFPEEGTPLEAQIRALNAAVCKILLIDTELSYDASDAIEMPPVRTLPEYWQIRRSALGFLPDLSVLDPIFNLGPEAAVAVRAATLRVAK